MSVFPLAVPLPGDHKQPHWRSRRQRQRFAKGLRGGAGRCRATRTFGLLPQVRRGERVAQLQLPLGPVVVVGLATPHHFEGQVGGGNPVEAAVLAQHLLLLTMQFSQVRSMIHPPDALLAHLGDIPAQLGQLQVGPQPLNQAVQPLGVLRDELAVEHVVLSLVPADRFEAIGHSLLVEGRKRLADQLQRAGIELLPLGRRVGIPVAGHGGSSDRRLDDGDGDTQFATDPPGEGDLGPERPEWPQRFPAHRRLGTIAQHIGEADLGLRLARPPVGGVLIDLIGMRVGPDHVRLPCEHEHPHRFFAPDHAGGEPSQPHHPGQRPGERPPPPFGTRQGVKCLPPSLVGAAKSLSITPEAHHKEGPRVAMGSTGLVLT